MLGPIAESTLAWWPGDEPNYQVLGLSVRTWGRVGKIMQFLGGLVALIDIVGEVKLTEASRRLAWRAESFSHSQKVARRLRVALVVTAVAPFFIGVGMREAGVAENDVPDLIYGAVIVLPTALFAVTSARAVRWLNRLISEILRLLARLSHTSLHLRVLGFSSVVAGFFLDLAAS